MGLRDRIFRRGEDPATTAPAPEGDAPAGEPAAPADGNGDGGLWAQPDAQPDDLTVIQRPGDEPDEQPTVIQPAAAETPDAPADAAEQAEHVAAEPAPGAPEGFVVDPGAVAAVPARPGFRERGKLRRRLRYLREVRELGFRDLGGLVFDQHRFQRPNELLVYGKVEAIDAVDREIRAIEDALQNRTPYSELFIPGVSACQRCGALHGSDARYCPYCGLAFSGPRTLAGIAPDQASYGTPGAATAPGQAVLFDPHTGAPLPQPPVAPPLIVPEAQPQPTPPPESYPPQP